MDCRHLDQVILCSIYGVAKVNKVKPEITFKGILEVRLGFYRLRLLFLYIGPSLSVRHSFPRRFSTSLRSLQVYKQMPHHSTKVSVIRDIVLHDGSRGDIVKFYNKVNGSSFSIFSP